jgi:hypothetical protein
MSTLRVLLPAAPSPARADAWALFDATGNCVRSGRDQPSQWPDAATREAVLAASAVRLVALKLPPMTADRVGAAVAFALEDRLAGPAQEHDLVAAPQAHDGTVVVTIAPRALTQKLRATFTRVVAEPALTRVPQPASWHWHASAVGGGFLRKPDGSAFAVSVATPAAIPPELALALVEAAQQRVTPGSIHLMFDAPAEQCAAWSVATGVPFTADATWRWDRDGGAFARAPDLLPRTVVARTEAPGSARRLWRSAAIVAGIALLLHVAATATLWSWLRIDAWRTERALVALAQSAGAGEHADADAAAAALARTFATARHRAGLSAPADALPLLARAAPALAALPPASLRTATYAAGSWTFDLQKVEPAALDGLDAALGVAGLSTLRATTASGARVRIVPAPGTQRP